MLNITQVEHIHSLLKTEAIVKFGESLATRYETVELTGQIVAEVDNVALSSYHQGRADELAFVLESFAEVVEALVVAGVE